MVKRRNQPMIDSDSSSSSESGSDLDSELLSLAKKRKNADGTASKAKSKAKHSSDSDSDDDDDWADGKNTSGESAKASSSSAKTSPKSPEKKQTAKEAANSDHEEGEVSSDDDDSNSASDDSDSSSSSSDSEFDDGFDENLMGDDEDRARLNALSEKERETEIFKRIERRDMMRTRWEIERKLKLARRGDKARDKTKKEKKKKKKVKKKEVVKEKSPVVVQRSPSPMPAPKPVEAPPPTPPSPEKEEDDDEEPAAAPEYFDPKERSKERKKNVEANKTDDKRSNAMAMLKAKREGKAKREEEEAKRQAEKEREEEKDELESVSGGKSAVKLKASDIYSDDSGSSSSSDSDDEEPSKPSEKRQSVSSRSSSSEWDEETSTSTKKSTLITTREDLNKLRLSRHKMERFINLPMFEKVVTGCFVRISIGNNGTKAVYRVAEVVGVVETPKIYQFGRSRTNRGLRLKHGAQERVFRLEFISNQDFTESEYDKWRKVCDTSNVQMPAMEMLNQKQREINEALNYEFKDEDVHKIIAEKNRFRQRPTNYAMKKTMLMKERDAALLRGDDEVASKLGVQIDELETRANELDKRRSSSISLISYINDRNRKRNVEEAERAIMEEIRATKGMKIEDPFTRRTTQPRMTFNKNEAAKEEVKPIQPQPPPLPGRRKQEEDSKPKSASSDYNLYKLHDFEIDLDVPLPNNPVSVLPKAVAKSNETAPKRSLNLEDYKKKRGLI